jgi:alpha/beta superfamily hydrolase
VVSPQATFDWVAGLARKPKLVVLKGAGHFFHGRLNEVRQAVVNAFPDGQ